MTAAGASYLKLTVSPFAKMGNEISAIVEASNVSETLVELNAPDTVLISQPHRQIVGKGTFKRKITWLVEHVQGDTPTIVEINVSAGSLNQTGLCRIIE